MTRDDLRHLLQTFSEEAFRLELLNRYEVPSELEDFSRFLSGEPLPAQSQSWWTELIAESSSAGKQISRVHIVPQVLTPYLQFEIEWGYLYSATAGEEIYLLPEANVEKGLLARARATGDFWLFDNQIGVMMNYDKQGRFLGPEPAVSEAVPELVTLKDDLLALAVPLREYLASVRNPNHESTETPQEHSR